MLELWCSNCREDKPQGDFHKDASKKRGYDNICASCKKLYDKGRVRLRKPAFTADVELDVELDIEDSIPNAPSADDYRQLLRTSFSASRCMKPTSPSSVRRVVAFGDTHGNPHPLVIQKIIEAKPDIIVHGGDALNMEDVSTHVNTWNDGEKDESERELLRTRAAFETLREETRAKIYLMTGNHDHRVQLTIMTQLGPRFARWIKNPLALLIEGLPDVELVRNELTLHEPNGTVHGFGESRYIFPVGDALISHANFVGSKNVSAVQKLFDKVSEWTHSLGIDPRLFIQFHAHNMSKTYRDGGHICLVEPGAAFIPTVEAYKAGYNFYSRPGVIGAVQFDQVLRDDKWVTDMNSIQHITVM